MLVLARRREESVQIVVPPSTEPLIMTLRVFEVGKSVVRFGFDAPKEVIILRSELDTAETPQVLGLTKAV